MMAFTLLSASVMAQTHAGDSVMLHAKGNRLSVGGYGEVGYTREFFSDHVNRYSTPQNYKNDPAHGRFDIPHAVIYVGYDFGPFSVQWFTNFAGADGRTSEGKRAYMSYIEGNVPFALGGLDWNATIGIVPYCAYNGFYATNCSGGFAVNSISLKASKDIKITDSFSVPVFAQVATNPSTQTAGLVFGFTLKP